jgi:hypothetical protein
MYRIKSTGEIASQGELRKLFRNTSFPRVWDESVLDHIGVDPVFESPTPTTTRYQTANKNGVEFKNDKWMWAWTLGPVFTGNEEATAAEQEAAYKAAKDAEQAKSVRASRDAKLAATDWVVIKAVETSTAVPAETAAIRQALRDITSQAGFPWTITWPDAP